MVVTLIRSITSWNEIEIGICTQATEGRKRVNRVNHSETDTLETVNQPVVVPQRAEPPPGRPVPSSCVTQVGIWRPSGCNLQSPS